jgi:hypothetical protein
VSEPDAAEGRRVRVAVLDARPTRFQQSARRVLLRAGVERALELTARDPRRSGERAQALRDAHPDVVLVPLADRSDADSAVYLAEALRFGCATLRPPPRVIVATNDDGAIARATLLFSAFPLEVMPDLRTDNGRVRVAERLRETRRAGTTLRDDALEQLAARAAGERRTAACVLDVSGASTSIARAEPSGQLVAIHVRPLGIGTAADAVVAGPGLERVRRWLPPSLDAPTLLDRVFDRARSRDGAVDDMAIAIEIALAREAVTRALVEARAAGASSALGPVEHAILTGRLASLEAADAEAVVLEALGKPAPREITREQDVPLPA